MHDEHDEGRDPGLDGVEIGDETEEDDEPEEVETPRARRTNKRATASAKPARVLTEFGSVPDRATHWAIRRQTPAQTWEACEAPSPDGAVALREWPLGELSRDVVRARFGPGLYRVHWIGTSRTGGRVALGQGRDVRILPPVVVEPPPPPSVAAPVGGPVLPPEFQQTFALMGMFEQMQSAKLAQIGQMAQLFAGGQRGPDTAVLEMMRDMMREQREAAERQTQLILRALEGDDDDGDDEPAAPPSRASNPPALPVFKPGESVTESMKAMFMNWAASNPDQAVGLAKEALGVVSKLANVATNVAAPSPARPPARAVQVTRRDPPALEPSSAPPNDANGAASANAAYVAASVPAAPSVS